MAQRQWRPAPPTQRRGPRGARPNMILARQAGAPNDAHRPRAPAAPGPAPDRRSRSPAPRAHYLGRAPEAGRCGRAPARQSAKPHNWRRPPLGLRALPAARRSPVAGRVPAEGAHLPVSSPARWLRAWAAAPARPGCSWRWSGSSGCRRLLACLHWLAAILAARRLPLVLLVLVTRVSRARRPAVSGATWRASRRTLSSRVSPN